MSGPPGRHCLPDQGLGFCLLANLSIVVEVAIAKHGIKKVAVLDWDLHHGNGTQTIFYERDDVLTIFLHQEACFPPGYSRADDRGAGEGEGEGYNINVPRLPGSGLEAYRYAMERIVTPAIEGFEPELIVVAGGLDANCVDPLARMLAHTGTFQALTEQTMALADRFADGRIVMVHEGGYAESALPFCVHGILEVLSGEKSDVEDPPREMCERWQPNEQVTAIQRELIDEIANLCGATQDAFFEAPWRLLTMRIARMAETESSLIQIFKLIGPQRAKASARRVRL